MCLCSNETEENIALRFVFYFTLGYKRHIRIHETDLHSLIYHTEQKLKSGKKEK